MGMEYKIQVKLDKETIGTIAALLQNNILFDKIVPFNNEHIYEFRTKSNSSSIPDFSIIMNSDSIYVCRYDCLLLWQDIEDLKAFMDRHIKSYAVLDYQE